MARADARKIKRDYLKAYSGKEYRNELDKREWPLYKMHDLIEQYVPVFDILATLFPEYKVVLANSSYIKLQIQKKAIAQKQILVSSLSRYDTYSIRFEAVEALALIVLSNKENVISDKEIEDYIEYFTIALLLPNGVALRNHILKYYEDAFKANFLHELDKEEIYRFIESSFWIIDDYVEYAHEIGYFRIPKMEEEKIEISRENFAKEMRNFRNTEKALKADLEHTRAMQIAVYHSENANRPVG